MAPRELISIVPLVVELSTRVTLLLQLNVILLKWKIQQISQNAATEAAKRPFSHAQLNIFIPVNWAGVFIWVRSSEIPVAKTEISVDRAGPVLIWTHRDFYKGNSGRARSRLTGLIWTGRDHRNETTPGKNMQRQWDGAVPPTYSVTRIE